jgi:hypothetical protein
MSSTGATDEAEAAYARRITMLLVSAVVLLVPFTLHTAVQACGGACCGGEEEEEEGGGGGGKARRVRRVRRVRKARLRMKERRRRRSQATGYATGRAHTQGA